MSAKVESMCLRNVIQMYTEEESIGYGIGIGNETDTKIFANASCFARARRKLRYLYSFTPRCRPWLLRMPFV